MKLILAIIQDHVAQDVLHELSENKIRATKLSSTGGFFKKGNTTILIGIEDEKVECFWIFSKLYYWGKWKFFRYCF